MLSVHEPKLLVVPVIVVEGRVNGVPTKMLEDTGSVVILVREDLREQAMGSKTFTIHSALMAN